MDDDELIRIKRAQVGYEDVLDHTEEDDEDFEDGGEAGEDDEFAYGNASASLVGDDIGDETDDYYDDDDREENDDEDSIMMDEVARQIVSDLAETSQSFDDSIRQQKRAALVAMGDSNISMSFSSSMNLQTTPRPLASRRSTDPGLQSLSSSPSQRSFASKSHNNSSNPSSSSNRKQRPPKGKKSSAPGAFAIQGRQQDRRESAQLTPMPETELQTFQSLGYYSVTDSSTYDDSRRNSIISADSSMAGFRGRLGDIEKGQQEQIMETEPTDVDETVVSADVFYDDGEESDEVKKIATKKRRSKIIGVVVAIKLVFLIAGILVFFLVVRPRDKRSKEDTTEEPIKGLNFAKVLDDCASADQFDDTLIEYDIYLSRLGLLNDLDVRLSGPVNSCGPENLAAMWVANEEFVLGNDTSPAGAAPRYVLASLYFSLQGPQWPNQMEWLQIGESHCLWYGVECEDGIQPTKLGLGSNNLGGSLPATIGMLSQLTALDFQKNSMTGELPTEINLLTNLEELWLSDNEFSGTMPDITGLRELEIFSFSGNTLQGAITKPLLDLWKTASNITKIYLDQNKLTGGLPTEIGDMTLLQQFHVDTNFISSTIPTEIGRLTNLRSMDIGLNHISGTLPSEVGLLAQLEQFYYQDLSLSGTIPTELFGLKKLRILQGNSNTQLGGTIPTEIGLITTLDLIGFYSNRLTGTLPSEIGLLTGLTDMSFTLNNLHGTIPKEFANLTNLNMFELLVTNNDVVGPVDPGLCDVFNRIEFCQETDCPCCYKSPLSGCIDPFIN